MKKIYNTNKNFTDTTNLILLQKSQTSTVQVLKCQKVQWYSSIRKGSKMS